MRNFKLFFLHFLILGFNSYAEAYEFLSLINKDCQVHSGFLVGNEEDRLSLLNAQGGVDAILAADVDQIVVHNLLELPFSLKQVGPSVEWYEITLLDESRSTFLGTPIQFVDQLIFFLNDKGTIEVTPLQQIANLRKLTERRVSWQGKSVALDFSAARLRCPDLSATGSVPSRVLNDPIQIDEFLRNFETGFARFHQLNERMSFYAKPMLVKDTVRMGFPFVPKNAETWDTVIFNVKFSSGVPFGLQSATTVGSVQNEWLPFYLPQLAASFEIKSHLFHAVLVTHLPSISGGSSAFRNNLARGSFEGTAQYHYGESAPFVLSKSFNYLTMFGIDLKKWSFSIGGYFPINFAFVNGDTREMLAKAPQLTGRVMYTTDKWRFRVSGSKYDLSHTTEGKNPTLEAYTIWNNLTGLTGKTTGYFVRGGWDWDLSENVQANFDLLQNHWSYTESSNLGLQLSENTFAASIKKDFGRYVNMKAYVAHTAYTWDATHNNNSYAAPLNQNLYGGEFEFIF